ncbi:hypothetical protein SLA2020_275630 [Shorea laevis]
MGITGVCSRLIGDVLHAFGSPRAAAQPPQQLQLTCMIHNAHAKLTKEVLGGLDDVAKRKELLHEAFKIFDEDGDGYIEAVELKRVDFSEFQLMMS